MQEICGHRPSGGGVRYQTCGILRGVEEAFLMRTKLLFFMVALTAIAVRTASAQVDFSGEWAPRFHEDQPERVPGPPLGDYLGLPINDAARLRADSWDASMMTLPEWQCRP